MAKRFVFTGKQKIDFEDFTSESLTDDSVHIKNSYTLMSTGTENIVFNRLFEAGTHWDNWVKYPFYPGYAAVGEVIAVGKNVTNFSLGQKVAHRGSHASEATVEAGEVSPVPDGIELTDAVWFALAKIAFMGARTAEYFLGDTVLIIGAGPIGQMSIRWARAAGVQTIVVVDMVDKRLELATKGGATCIISERLSDDLLEKVTSASLGNLPQTVIDTTGNAAVFNEALKFAGDRGKVIILGDTGTPSQQHLSADVIIKGLTIRGAHDCHTDDLWRAERIHQLFFSLLNSGRFPMTDINTHILKPEDYIEAYRLANEEREKTMGIIFDWT